VVHLIRSPWRVGGSHDNQVVLNRRRPPIEALRSRTAQSSRV
jgi:hypothetical protein